jgi:hypothetical protein
VGDGRIEIRKWLIKGKEEGSNKEGGVEGKGVGKCGKKLGNE